MYTSKVNTFCRYDNVANLNSYKKTERFDFAFRSKFLYTKLQYCVVWKKP